VKSAYAGLRQLGEVSLVPKMAESPAEVLKFLDELAVKARPFAEHDWTELREFAAAELGLNDVRRGMSPTRPKSCARSAIRSPTTR
jgi:Zn-dependent oligopeptidase